jgi:hypothetical protein
MSRVWFRIENGVAVEVFETDPTGLFHPDLIWIEADDSVNSLGDVWENGAWRKPTSEDIYQTLDDYKAELYMLVEGIASTKIMDAESKPEAGVHLSYPEARIRKSQRSIRTQLGKARLSSSESSLLKYIESVYKVAMPLLSRINRATSFKQLDAVNAEGAAWPNWSPPQ